VDIVDWEWVKRLEGLTGFFEGENPRRIVFALRSTPSKNKQLQRQMRGFFATLRMTSKRGDNGKRKAGVLVLLTEQS
jgi:hypothetical protein